MDTTHKGNIGEHATALSLQRAGFLVAKPYFDKDGADLLAFAHIGDGAKFARVQCKYRQPKTSIKVPTQYAEGAFVCFLCSVPTESDDDGTGQSLYAFFVEDVKAWGLRAGNYVLRVPSYKHAAKKFRKHAVNVETFARLRRLIEDSDVGKEFGGLDFANPRNMIWMVGIL